ncbi:MAG: DUF456 domain-containing protein [Tidjanibacter sp.]|nr:DUF456 domain-containing protein [Tidjanibacter sp.]
MITFLEILALLFIVVGVLGSILPALPGPPICYIGMLLIHWSTGAFDGNTLVMWAVVVVAVTILDNLLPIWFTKKFGGSKRAAWGATIGVLVGLFLGPVGVLFGPFCGALIGELSLDSKDSTRAFRAAFGSFAAFIFGVGLKLACCVAIAIPIVKSIFS